MGGFFFGAPGRIRTCDLPVRSRALYPLSYKRIYAFAYLVILAAEPHLVKYQFSSSERYTISTLRSRILDAPDIHRMLMMRLEIRKILGKLHRIRLCKLVVQSVHAVPFRYARDIVRAKPIPV